MTTGIDGVSLDPTQFHVFISNYFLYIANRILDSKQSPYYDRSYLWRLSFSQDIPSFGGRPANFVYFVFSIQ